MRLPSSFITLLVAFPTAMWGQASSSPAWAAQAQIGTPPFNKSQLATVATATSIQVNSSEKENTNEPSAFKARAADVLSSAGTYGDFSRYLQTFPGVVFNSDESNDVLVRGGNPIENLYLVDGIEVPDINHVTGLGTTGGFSSMIDTASTRSIDFNSGGYSAQYAERLSSVISVHTLGSDPLAKRKTEGDAGYVGLGGNMVMPLGQAGSILITGHRSLLNMVTNNIGINGVPTFTNAMVSGAVVTGTKDAFAFLSLTGVDGVDIDPCGRDPIESNPIQTQYGGWRTTNGAHWQHGFSPAITTILTASDSEQSENIQQQDQVLGNSRNCGSSDVAGALPEVYREKAHDGTSILQYEAALQLGSRTILALGSQARLNRIAYDVEQPVGQLSPFSANPARSDATSFSPTFASGQSGSWAELTFQISRPWSITAGGRLQTFVIGGEHFTATPRLRTSYQIGAKHSVYAAMGYYAQQPSLIYVESYAQNHILTPIHVQHLVLGSELWKTERLHLRLEMYRKHYWGYPVASEYPQLSLANMVDTLGQQYVWLPLVSQGHGHTYGAELSSEVRLGPGLFTQANVSWSRAFYSGTDEVSRPGNFDFPIVLNVSTIWRSPRRYEVSIRYEFTTGRPYTPYLMAPSLAQNRGIYDLSKVNAMRGPMYSRLDFQVSRILRISHTEIDVYGGVENALDRQNFLANEWLPRCAKYQSCDAIDSHAVGGAYIAVPQIALYPNFGIRTSF